MTKYFQLQAQQFPMIPHRVGMLCGLYHKLFVHPSYLDTNVPHDNPVGIGLIMHAYLSTIEAILYDISKIAQLQQHMDGLLQERGNSSAKALELRLSFSNSSI